MMEKSRYVNRSCQGISAEEWSRLQDDKDYVHVRSYADDDITIFVAWRGLSEAPFQMILRHPNSYAAKVINAGTEGEIINLYEDYLVRENKAEWIKSNVVSHHFVEFNNKLKPLDKGVPVQSLDPEVDESLINSW